MDPEILKKLNTVRRQYLQLVEPNKLRWPDASILKAPTIQSWIYDNLFNKDRIPYSPPDRYQLRVLKPLITNIERAFDDPEEDVRLLFHRIRRVATYGHSLLLPSSLSALINHSAASFQC
jgi:hypothetical protein